MALGLAVRAIGGDDIRPLLVALAVIFALAALLVHRALSTDMIRLMATHVEISDLFGARRLPLSEIAAASSSATGCSDGATVS